MKKQRKKASVKKSNRSNASNVVDIKTGRLHKSGQVGVYDRQYPTYAFRQSAIERVLQKVDAKRTQDDWWILGEYQCLDGLINEDDHLINKGIEALMSGAEMTPPSVACLMDLGWLFSQKRMGQMAIKYLDKAISIHNDSRDIWSLRGWASIGAGHRDLAIESFQRACALMNATQTDRDTLDSLVANEDLKEINKKLIFNKIDIRDILKPSIDHIEAAKIAIYVLKSIYETDPDDLSICLQLATSRYIAGQYDRAESLLKNLINNDQFTSDSYTILGLIANKNKNVELSEEYYKQAINADNTNVLANTNLASILQDKGDFHSARGYLERALKVAEDNDPHLSIALDLYGNNIAAIDEDYELEIQYHNRAINLDKKNPLFHSNLIIALLSAGRIIDARRAYQTIRSLSIRLPNEELLSSLFKLYSSEQFHPFQYMEVIENLFPVMGKKAVLPLIKLAWKYRKAVQEEDLTPFYYNIGIFASNAAANELALEIWKEGAKLEDSDNFTVNIVAELSNLNRHSEALEAAQSMSLTTTNRSWTVLGNVNMSAGFYKKAIAAYKEALHSDEKFLLPFQNALNCAVLGFLTNELDPFIEALEQDWLDVKLAQAIRANYLMLKGEYLLAIKIFQNVLYSENDIITPEELWDNEYDITVSSIPSMNFHYCYALCLLKCKLIQPLYDLIQTVQGWSKWHDGDWKIIYAELFVLNNESDKSLEILDSMAEQPPVFISKAIIFENIGQIDERNTLISKGLNHPDYHRFNHPLGASGSVLQALNAEVLFSNQEIDKAELAAKEAVIFDPTCVVSRLISAKIFGAMSRNDEKRTILEEGLERVPGNPDLLNELVPFLAIDMDDVLSASVILDKNRPLLERNDFTSTAHELGELVALVKLSKIESAKENINDNVSTLEWEFSQPLIIREWLFAAKVARQKSILKSAYVMYLAKIAELLLINNLFSKFRDVCKSQGYYDSDQYRDMYRYIQGGNAPSLGAMHRLFNDADKSYRSNEEPIVTGFREFISSGKAGASKILRDKKFINQLGDLARLRNSVAHIDEADLDPLMDSLAIVLKDNDPGILFKAFTH